MAPVYNLKDRFQAKRLRTFVDSKLPEGSAKREVIERRSAFKSFLKVSPFAIPNRLLDFIVTHTSHKLREFSFHGKRIVFTRDMVRKVFDIPSGNRKVDLITRGIHSDLRDVYKMGNTRPPIKNAETVLLACADTDEESIVRSWDMLVLGTVLNPGTGNMLCMDYLGCLADPFSSVDLAWDEHILDECMKHVDKIQEKKKTLREKGVMSGDFWISGPLVLLGVVYMDHLDYPPNDYVFDYSIPRMWHVTSKDFEFVVATDVEKKILCNSTIFGRRPFLPLSKTPYAQPVEPDELFEVNPSASLNEWLGPGFPSSQELEIPARFKHLHEKHKAILATDIDATVKNLGIGLKRMYSQRLSALLVDVDAAIRGEDGPSVVFPSEANGANGEHVKEVVMDEADDDEEDDDDYKDAEAEAVDDHPDTVADANVQAHIGVPDVPQPAVVIDTVASHTDDLNCVDSPVRSPCRSVSHTDDLNSVDSPVRSPYRFVPPGISEEAWNRAPDPPSMDLFPPGSEEYAMINYVPNDPSQKSDALAAVDDTATSCVAKPAVDDTASTNAGTSVLALAKVDAAAQLGEPKTPAVPNSPGTNAGTSVLALEKVDAAAHLGEPKTPAVPNSQGTNAGTSVLALEKVDAAAHLGEPKTPAVPNSPVVGSKVSNEKEATTGVETIEKRNRAKRATKDELTPPKMKKLKVNVDVVQTYDKFVTHGRKLKRQTKKQVKLPKPFVQIGRSFCTYRSFMLSLKPRQPLDSEVMEVWVEKHNREVSLLAGRSQRSKKKYVFSQIMMLKLIVDPSSFNPKDCMKEFKAAVKHSKILKDDLLYFPVVKDFHWMVCCVNLVHKQYHIFDSMLQSNGTSKLQTAANNLFTNFRRLLNESGLLKIDWSQYKLITPNHPQQENSFDCGFYSILYMDQFTGKVMAGFDVEDIPYFRKYLAANLISNRDNNEPLDKIMEAELQAK